MSSRHAKVVIIGSGPAGYTAAVYTARANLDPILFEGGGATIEPITVPGGQLMITTDVENYPGFPEAVTGPELMERFQKQAQRFGTKLFMENVTKIDFSKRPFRVWVEGQEFAAQVMEFVRYHCMLTSVELSEQRGPFLAIEAACTTRMT